MKKILSLVMALTMVLGLNAAPVALKQQKARKSTSRMELVQKQKTAQPVAHQTAVKHAPKHFRHIDRTVMRKAPMAATVTFAPADFVDQGVEGTGGPVSATKDGVTVSTDLGFGHRAYNPATQKSDGDPDQFRVYIGGTLTIEATATMTKIEFTFEDGKDGNLNTSYTPNSTTWTSGELTKQARISSIVVTLDGEVPPTPPTPPTPVGDTTALTMLDAFEFGYYGSYSEEGAYNYSLVLYNSQDEENYVPQVGFDIYTETKDEFTGKFSAEGGNLGLDYSAFYPDAESEGEYFTDASVTITEGEGDDLVIEGIFTTEAGKTYTFSVTAEPYIYDAEHPYEPQEAKTFDLTAVDGEADETYFAAYGIVYYYLYMEDGSVVGLTYRTANGTQPQGTFAISDEEGVDAFLTGADYYGYPDGSYYETIDGDVYYFVSGSVTLTTDELGNTTITANATSCYGSTFTVTGVIGGKQPSGDHTIVIADYAAVSFTTLDGAYTVASAQNGGASAPSYNGTSEDLRLYAKNTFTLTKNTKDGPMTKIIFCISDKGLARQADIAVSTGEIVSYDMDNALVTWTGEASEVVFTVGDKATHGSDGATKAGQFDFTAIDIEYAATGLISTKANKVADKCFINGQLMIIKDGKQYNVLGVAF